jgi:RND superfamily putative drug exporter
MFKSLGNLIVKRKKSVFAFFIAAILVMGGVGSLAFAKLDSGGYSDPKSDSAKAAKYLTDTFHIKDPAALLIVRSKNFMGDSVSIADARDLETSIAAEKGVAKTLSYWSAGMAPSLLSKDRKGAYIFIYTKVADPFKAKDLGKVLASKYDGTYKSFRLYAGGLAVFNHAINEKISKDLAIAESISIPLTFILLAFVFGGLIASAMPLVVGISAILGAFFFIYIITLFTGVSVFALNLITGMGLGLGIDYALLIVNRFREEIHHGKSVDEAVIKTVETAGKTVFYSGITVIITLASLMFFPQMFLKSFGYAGVTVVAMAIVGALIPLPAILAMLGHRIDKIVVRRSAITPKEDGRWADTARLVMRRPVTVVVLSLIVMGLIAAPIKNVVFSQVDSRVMPASAPVAITAVEMAKNFPGQEGNPIEFIVPNGASQQAAIANFEAKLASVPGVVHVIPGTIEENTVHFSAIHEMSARTPAAESMIDAIRALPHPIGMLVGGVAADYADSQNGIAKTLPFALSWIILGVLILLFLFTGSLILPVKAVILNVISLAAMMGAMTWIFIDGHFMWLVGKFTITGSIDTSMVILVAVVTFGLSMDYEVFLFSRIKEEHDSGKSNVEAVATGLQRSARIITAAALLLAIVFAAFLTSGVTSIKTLGFGVAFAILVDASIVRALLVPALMRLFGERNWWAPLWMKRFTINH